MTKSETLAVAPYTPSLCPSIRRPSGPEAVLRTTDRALPLFQISLRLTQGANRKREPSASGNSRIRETQASEQGVRAPPLEDRDCQSLNCCSDSQPASTKRLSAIIRGNPVVCQTQLRLSVVKLTINYAKRRNENVQALFTGVSWERNGGLASPMAGSWQETRSKRVTCQLVRKYGVPQVRHWKVPDAPGMSPFVKAEIRTGKVVELP